MSTRPSSGAQRRRPDLLEVDVEGSRVVVDPAAGTAHVLNASAAQVWDLCGPGRDAREIAGELAERLSVAPDDPVTERLEADVRATVDHIEHLGLLEPSGPPTGRAAGRDGRRPLSPAARAEPGWAALGHRFSVSCDDPELNAALARDLRRLPRVDAVDHAYRIARGEGGWLVSCDGDAIAAADSLPDALAALHRQLRQRSVENTDGRLVLHAGAIRSDDRVVALPAPSGGGKSTLVTALVERGHAYLTDEAIALAPGSRRVLPLALPITLDAGSWPLFPHLEPTDPWSAPAPLSWAWRLSPDQPSSADDTGYGDHGELAVLVFHRYEPGSTTDLERLGTLDAVVAGVECTFGLDDTSRGQELLDALVDLVEGVECHRLVHGDLDQAVAAVESIVT